MKSLDSTASMEIVNFIPVADTVRLLRAEAVFDQHLESLSNSMSSSAMTLSDRADDLPKLTRVESHGFIGDLDRTAVSAARPAKLPSRIADLALRSGSPTRVTWSSPSGPRRGFITRCRHFGYRSPVICQE